MITPLLLVLCPMLQDLAGIPRLEPGVEVRGQLVDQPLEYRFRVEVDGPVHLDLQSLFFDARLELRAVDGSLLGEADEGSIGRHARLEVEAARKGTEYRVLAMAQDGGTGDFSLVLVLGAAPQLDAIAKEERTLADAKARVAAVAERFGERSAELADALYALGWTLYLGDRLEESVASYERSLAIREELFGRDAPVTLTTTDYLALALHAMSRHAEAEALYRRSLNARLRDLETDDRMIAYSAFNLAQQLKFQGRYREALPLYEEALRVRVLRDGPEGGPTRGARAGLASCFKNLGDFEPALGLYREALRQVEEDEAADPVEVASRLDDVGDILVRMGRQREAIEVLERALVIYARERGEDDLDYAWSLVNLGRAVEADGRYREALPLFQRALAIHVDAGVRASPGGAYALEALGACQFRMGRYERAASCFEDGIAIRRKVFGAEHLDTATLVHDLAIVRQNQGRSDEARALYDQAIAAKVTEVGREHPETAVTLHALAKLFLEQGLYDEARPLLVEAREIRERTLGKDHFLVATSIQDLALLDRDEGNLDAALAGLEKALDMRRKVFGDRHRQVGFSLHNLAEVLEARGDDAAAQRYFEEALAVRRAVLDAGHPHVAASLHGLGRVLWHRGDLEGARERLEQALAIREAVLLPEHPDRARNLHDLALLHADRGDFPAAWARAREAVSALEEHLQRVLWAQTESERFRFLESRHTALAILTSLAQRSGDPQAERIAYQAVLDWKGGATRAMLRGKARLEAGLDEGQRALLEDLRAAQAELSALMFSKDTAQRDTQVAALRDERARLELALNRSMGKQQADPAVDLDALRHALAAAAPDAAAVDFLVLSQYEPAAGADRAGAFGVPRLLVWTVRAGAEGVQRQDIGPADEVETLVRAFLEDLVARRGGEGLDGGDAGPNSNDVLRARLWDPLAAAIGPAGLVFLSPDSFLGGLPFETLQGGDTAYLIEDFAFVYQEDLVSLLTPPRARPQGHGLLAIGGVDYGRRAPGTVVSAARKYWPTLSATGPEADAVSQIHRDAFGAAEPRELLEGEAASEGVLKAALPEYEFLHLATHGYFEPEGLASMFERVVEDGRRVQRMRAPDRQLVRSLPGLLSGLICAGANLPVSGQGDDAYLTAEEVSWLPLTGVDTVVLSACETGLGRAQAGEGMLGLRRSFRMAGARTVISSLWEVRDAETGKLMQAYYRNLWLEGRGKLESLRAAQLEMLDENRRSKAGKGRPSTWGAFVLSGDWR